MVDLLTRRVDPLVITGMLVCNAHALSDTSTEAFILRIFRRATAAGFIKAFTDDPLSLVAGFGKLEKTMRALYIRKLFLWPRFHEVVRQQLSAGKPEVSAGRAWWWCRGRRWSGPATAQVTMEKRKRWWCTAVYD